MSEVNIFEQASRKDLLFNSPQGALSVTDLWHIPLTSTNGRANLDDIARSLSNQVKSQGEESFVLTPAKVDSDVQLSFDIVKRVIEVRLAENKAKLEKAEIAKKKAQLTEALAAAQNKELGSKTPAEIQAMIAEL